MKSIIYKIDTKQACALLAGVLLTLAFSPFDIYVLAWVSPAWLFYLIQGKPFKKSLVIGLHFGFGFGATALYWFFITLNQFAGLSIPIAIILTGLIVLIFAIFYALSIGMSSYFNHNKIIHALAFIALWLIAEWIRGNYFFSGFPWLILGFSQSHGWLSAFAPIVGVRGLSLLSLILAMALALCFISDHHWQRQLSTIIIAAILLSSHFLSNKSFSTAKPKKKLSVALLQGNIAQSIKWQPNTLSTSIKRYDQLNKAAMKKAQLIIWPESALPAFKFQLQGYLDQLGKQALKSNSAIIIGIPTQVKQKYYNSAIALGSAKGKYSKAHLVPFGEYIPLPWLTRPIASILNIPMSSFSPGSKNKNNLVIHGMPVGLFICYEIAFSQLVRQHAQQAMFLITINDDTWYGSSIALYQHLQMASVQAKSLGRYLLFCSNSGITAIIDNNGKIIDHAPINKVATVRGIVVPHTGLTPYALIGSNWIIWLCFIILIILIGTELKKWSK